MVKGFLSLRNVKYIVKNVTTDIEGREKLLALGYDSTPVAVIGNQVLPGFDAKAIDQALAALG